VGAVEASVELGADVRDAWMVIEAVPEKLELKRQVFDELDELAEPDASRLSCRRSS
jgi:3-hydroxybutyryl-CoA dehydrogenase